MFKRILIFIFSVFVITALSLVKIFGFGFTTINQPQINFISKPVGIGLNPSKAKFEIIDEDSGLYEISVTLKYNSKKNTIVKKKYLSGEKRDTIEIDLPSKKDDIKDRFVELEILAYDNSFWVTPARFDLSLPIDFRKPQIEVISTQHNFYRGGTQLVIFKARDNESPSLQRVGLKVGSNFYQAFMASKVGYQSSFPEDTFLALFAMPYEYDDEVDPPLISVDDEVLNNSKLSFYYKLKDVRSVNRSTDLKTSELPKEFLALIDFFKLSSSYCEKSSGIEPVQFGLENFQRPIVGPERMSFGDIRNGKYGDQILFSYRYPGVEVLYQTDQVAVAPANGRVHSILDFGQFGYALIIDHGLNLFSSMYGLDQLSVESGNLVSKGDRLAVTKKNNKINSILENAYSSGYFFSLCNTPVRPSEFLDPTWFNEHIRKKIQQFSSNLQDIQN